jgi:hypothetical protein
MTLLDDMRALADEWENYECECDDSNLGPYCLYRWGVHDFGKELRLRLDAAVEA